MKLRYILQDIDRHGKARTYVRWKGVRVRLRANPGSAEFFAEYRAAIESIKKPRKDLPPRVPIHKQVTPGSLRWLCDQYEHSGEFKRLDPMTQRARRGLMSMVCESVGPTGKQRGKSQYKNLEPKHIRKLRDEHADTPEGANGRVKMLRRIFDWAIAADLADDNPAKDVPYFPSRPEGFHTWTIEEVDQFVRRHPPGTKAHLALSLLLLTGVRRSDVVRLGRQMVRDGWLSFVEFKRRNVAPKTRDIPILPQLQAAIDAVPADNLTFLVTEYGRPYSAAGFGNWFRRRCDEAGLTHCAAHGLRKAGATIAAQNGATAHQLMAIFGWASIAQAQHYTLRVDRRRLAGEAMHLLAPEQGANEKTHPKSVVTKGESKGGG